MDATAHSNLISCLYPPPPRDRVPVYDQDWALFTSTDPFTIKRRLLDFYTQLYYTLESLADPARHLGNDISDGTDRDDIFGEVLKTRFIDLINKLLCGQYILSSSLLTSSNGYLTIPWSVFPFRTSGAILISCSIIWLHFTELPKHTRIDRRFQFGGLQCSHAISLIRLF
jgi:hypothetical protein